MNLEELTGKKILTGVDFSTETISSCWALSGECEACWFELDGVIYGAIEDPEDDYRSHMKELTIDEARKIKNTFPPCEVLCRYDEKGEDGSADLLELIDTTTGEVVLRVGTENTDDYYPWYTAAFFPEAMAINKGGDDD